MADERPSSSEGGGNVRGLGAIAAAVGVRKQDGMPAEFELTLGELIARVPEKFMWLGRHDERRVVRIAAADVAPGLARGRAEISLARLVALAPEVFRWERGETDDPQIRLPIQKLLQQIGSYAAELAAMPVEKMAAREERQPAPVDRPAESAALLSGEIVAERLPSIVWDNPPVSVLVAVEVAPAAEATPLPGSDIPTVGSEHATAETAPEPEFPASVVKPPPPLIPEHQPTISITATEPTSQPVQLRPQKEVSTSTTLRAVVLGGAGPVAATASSAPGFILAPRIAPVVGGAQPVVLAPTGTGPSVVSANDEATSSAPRSAPDFAGLQNLFMTGIALDLGGVAALAAGLPGVRACVISGAAGDAAAGDFAHGASPADVLTASAELARKGGNVSETLQRGDSDIALFLHDGVCVAAVLAAGSTVPGVRERLARVAELLAGGTQAH